MGCDFPRVLVIGREVNVWGIAETKKCGNRMGLSFREYTKDRGGYIMKSNDFKMKKYEISNLKFT